MNHNQLNNNAALSQELLARCTIPPPERMATIAEEIGKLEQLDLSVDEVVVAVHRIFDICTAENGRPHQPGETPLILIDVKDMLLKTRKNQHDPTSVRPDDTYMKPRLRGGGSISGI